MTQVRGTPVATKHKFPDNFITNCKERATKSFYNPGSKSAFQTDNLICLPYHPQLLKLQYPISLLGLKLLFTFDNTIEKLLIRNSPIVNEGIVYKINCNCGKYYIGQTSGPLVKRVGEHRRALIRGDENVAFGVHYEMCDGGFDW